MAHAGQTFWGIVIVLDHNETEQVLDVAGSVADIVVKLADLFEDSDLAIVGFVLDAVAFGISVHALIIEAVDTGNGVYLTTPWVALGTIIPTTRPPNIGLGDGWVRRRSGTFSTEDYPDLISYTVEPGAVAADVVEFKLEASDSRMWRKVLVMRDGLGSQWDIAIDPSQGTFSASNGLWADQVQNGQALSLWKAKQFGVMTWVLDIGHLEAITPGSRVMFKWWRDA